MADGRIRRTQYVGLVCKRFAKLVRGGGRECNFRIDSHSEMNEMRFLRCPAARVFFEICMKARIRLEHLLVLASGISCPACIAVTCNIMQLSMPHHIAETRVINGIVSQELQSSPRRRVANPDAFADTQV